MEATEITSGKGMELSGEYNTRTRIQAVREVFVVLGLIGAAAVPAIVETVYGADTTAVSCHRNRAGRQGYAPWIELIR